MNRWLASVAERPGWVLLGVLAFTIFSVQGIVDLRSGEPVLKIDPSTDRVLPSSGPERELFDRARKLFGGDEALVLALGADDVFTVENLDRVLRITKRVRAIEGVTEVTSLATAAAIRSEGGDLEVSSLLREKPTEADSSQLLLLPVNNVVRCQSLLNLH